MFLYTNAFPPLSLKSFSKPISLFKPIILSKLKKYPKHPSSKPRSTPPSQNHTPKMPTATTLEQPPATIHSVSYAVEDYVFEEAIPKLLDPLPYRKAGSVFANAGEEGESVITR